MEALAAYLLAHPWRSAAWLLVAGTWWRMGEMFGEGLYGEVKASLGRMRARRAADG